MGAGGRVRAEGLVRRVFESLALAVKGSGFRVEGSGFRVDGSGFRVEGSGSRVQGSRFRSRGHTQPCLSQLLDHCSGNMQFYYVPPQTSGEGRSVLSGP